VHLLKSVLGFHHIREWRISRFGSFLGVSIAVQAMLLGCGGVPSTIVITPTISYPQIAIVATVGQAITADTPTITGTSPTVSIVPVLPAGLSLNSSTGVISGTATTTVAQTTYTITALNSAGSTTTALSITVNAAVIAPAALIYPTTAINATIGQAISIDTPTVTGTTPTFSVSPSLPTGLSLNVSTGVISGTPTTAVAQATYTVTASNSDGSTTAALSITVNAAVIAPAALIYPTTAINATIGQAISIDTPTVTGTTPTFSVSPSLPTGLSLNVSTGVISGTPTTAVAQATYTVTASNSAGSITEALSITVNAAVIVPTALIYPTPTINATVGQAITTEIPTVSGTSPIIFSVATALPVGLTLNTSTGAISGTPTAVAAEFVYVVSATNSAGSTNASLFITVSPVVAPSVTLAYPQNSITAAVGDLLPSDIPSVTGTPTTFSIMPALPAGLSLNASTGVISGLPTATASQATYTVTGSNSSSTATASIEITIISGVTTLLKLGQTQNITFLQVTPKCVLSQSQLGHWALNDYTSAALIADASQGPNPSYLYAWPVALAGSSLAIGVTNGIDLRSTVDAHLIATIDSPSIDSMTVTTWWQMATDGSYIASGSPAGLFFWSTSTGNLLFSKTGDYSTAQAFATPSQLRIALGAAGQNVIETISTATFSSTVGPAFLGNFNTWFVDGSGFFTYLSTTVWVYSSSTIQQNILTVSHSLSPQGVILGGQGNYFWTYDTASYPNYPLTIYNVGASASAATYDLSGLAQVVPSGGTLGILQFGTGMFNVIDLSGVTPVESPVYTLPVAYLSAYAALSASQSVVGNQNGVVMDNSSSARYFTLGAAWSIAGGTSGAAIATASGSIYLFNLPSAIPAGIINFSSSSLAMSSNGSTLAAAGDDLDDQYETNEPLNIYSLPGQTLLATFPNTVAVPYYKYFELSGSGTVLAEVFAPAPPNAQETCTVGQSTGGTPIWSATLATGCQLALSPDGTLIAVSETLPKSNSAILPTTQIVQNGTLVTAVPGWAVGWLDNSRFIANIWTSNRISGAIYSSSVIYSSSGTLLGASGLNNVVTFQVVDANDVYVPALNQILSVTSGLPSWTGSFTATEGAVSGTYIIYATGTRVVAESF